ncbi:MAG: DNA polymerase III subunit beta [Clostridia bacterium]|nr:DNA polymerase III subunit beta [Clostridia bacterium]
MRFSVNTKELNEAVAIVTKAMPAHSSLPILEGIYIYASASTLFLKCSDLSLQIETEIPAFVEEEGSAVLPGRLFSELVRRFNGESVEFEGDKNSLKLRSDRVKTSLQVSPSDEYPEMRRVNDEFSAVISQAKLKSMIRQTLFAVSIEDSKPILNGICLEFSDDNRLRMIALDGFRLAMRNEKIKDCTGSKKVVIPSRAMQEIMNILSGEDEDIKLIFSGTHIKIDFGYTKLISRLLDGEYVSYTGILPKTHLTHAVVNCRALQESTERASLLAREAKSNLIKFTFEEEQLTISANSEKGSINDQMTIQLMGKPLEIAFNAKYIMDVMRVIDDETVFMRMNTSVTPCVIEPMEGDSFYFMVLPVRLFTGV